MGSSGSRDLSGQHHFVPQRSSFDSGAGDSAKGAAWARFRAGVSL